MIKPDEIIRTKRKSLALIVERDGRLIVRAPLRAREAAIDTFIQRKEKWVLRKQEHVKSYYPPFAPKEYVNGEAFSFLGQLHKLQIVDGKQPKLHLNGNFRLAQSALHKAEAVFEKWYRKQAYEVMTGRVHWYAMKHGFQYKQVRITSARRRWGSCNSQGTLCFSWRLVMAPMPVIDYVVIHELVHLQVKNHSKKFWRRVGVIMPNYEQKIEWLEKNGHLLNLK